MNHSPDYVARIIAGASLLIAVASFYLSWRKNVREVDALKPQVGQSAERLDTRLWRVRLTVHNPRKVPMNWRTVHAIRPAGLLINAASRVTLAGRSIDFDMCELYPLVRIPKEGAEIAPGETAIWEGYAYVDDRYGVRKHATITVLPEIDGFPLRPWLYRWIA